MASIAQLEATKRTERECKETGWVLGVVHVLEIPGSLLLTAQVMSG